MTTTFGKDLHIRLIVHFVKFCQFVCDLLSRLVLRAGCLELSKT